MTEIQRDEAFEKWHFNEYYVKDADKSVLYQKFEGKDEYVSYDVQHSYKSWQAAKASVAEGFVLVSKELPETIAEAMALERVPKPFGETDPVWIEISERSYRDSLLRKKWDLWRDYKAMIEAQEPAND